MNMNLPASSWLDSSVGRALHRHRKGHDFESRSSLNLFQAFFSQLLKVRKLQTARVFLLFKLQVIFLLSVVILEETAMADLREGGGGGGGSAPLPSCWPPFFSSL